jgi:hypothetical protein
MYYHIEQCLHLPMAAGPRHHLQQHSGDSGADMPRRDVFSGEVRVTAVRRSNRSGRITLELGVECGVSAQGLSPRFLSMRIVGS